MHFCPLFVIDPSPFASSQEIDAAVRRFETVAEVIGAVGVPASVHLSGPLLSALAQRKIEPDLSGVEWIRTGWAAPDLTSIPDRLAQLAISHEAEAMRRLRMEPGALWVRDWWDRRIPYLVAGAGIDCLLLHADLLGDSEPGVVAFLDRVVPVIPVIGHLPEPDADRDGLVLFTVPTENAMREMERAMELCQGRILTPRSYLTDHRPTGRYMPSAEMPSEDRESARLRRKMVRLATRLPDKLVPEASEELLAACHGPSHARGASIDLRRGAHEALIRARRMIDSDRHRGDDWTRVSRVDWDADGIEEIQVELSALSLVIDPTGEILALDDKAQGWAVNILDTESGGVICRFIDVDGLPASPELAVTSVQETKGSVSLRLTGAIGAGTVSCQFAVSGNRFTVAYELHSVPGGRLGLELALATAETRIRVDGSEWTEVSEQTPLAGHRFRLAGPTRQVLITSLTPADCFVRPTAGGVIAWVNWAVEGSANHQVSVDLSP